MARSWMFVKCQQDFLAAVLGQIELSNPSLGKSWTRSRLRDAIEQSFLDSEILGTTLEIVELRGCKDIGSRSF